CPDGTTRCHSDASCIRSISGYICKCNIGYAGDGSDCGIDSDLDGWPDVDLTYCKVQDHCSADNCPARPNSGQEDSDYDGIGDACDKIVNIYTGPTNPPVTTPLDDGFCKPRKTGSCPSTSDAWKTKDSDGDGHVDSCDNCPGVTNVDQTDSDDDLAGNACDTDQDTDNDGVDDGVDNCIGVVNPDQSDADYDGIGDKCDADADDDGIPNVTDNCWLTPNPGQEDANTDGFGDVCQDDKDGDCVPDIEDICPNISAINQDGFRVFHKVIFLVGEPAPEFIISAGGSQITQTVNSATALMYGDYSFYGVDYDGTFFIEKSDDDYAGFIFGYQSSKKFYVVMWKRSNQTYWVGHNSMAIAGLQLKKVHSSTGPSEFLADALWGTKTTAQVTLLWHDSSQVPWDHATSYRWQLIHRPHIGLIRFRFLTSSGIIADSGNIYDDDIGGGRLGIYCASQAYITWASLAYSCNDLSVPQEVYDDLPLDKQVKTEVDPSKSWSGKV
ncbi:unnamed protein product, partial [Meganyctiphanes norvegica]